MGNVSGKYVENVSGKYVEKIKTHILDSITFFFPKNMPFIR